MAGLLESGVLGHNVGMGNDPLRLASFVFAVSVREVRNIISQPVLAEMRVQDPLFKPSFTWLLIHMNDVLQNAAKFGARCAITADVEPHGREKDMTALIAAARAAACHIGSPLRAFAYEGKGIARMSWLFVTGQRDGGTINFTGQIVGANPYPDDMIISPGTVRLFARRNIRVCLDWIEAHSDEFGEFRMPESG